MPALASSFFAIAKRYTTLRTSIVTTLLLLTGPYSHSQSPIATAEMNGRKLELWSVEIGSSFDVNREMGSPFGSFFGSDLQKLKDAGKLSESSLQKLGMQFKRWEDSHSHESKVAVLGLLMREDNRQIASQQLSFSSALRVRGDDGKTISRWPNDNDCLLASRAGYKWDENYLSAFAVPISDKAKRIESVEGFAILSPVKKHQFVFELSDLQEKNRKSDGEVTVLPLEYAMTSAGMQVSFQMFRPMPEMKKRTRKPSSKGSPSEDEIVEQMEEKRLQGVGYEIMGQTANGMVQPNGSMSASMSQQFSGDSSIKTELRLRAKETKDTLTQSSSDRKKIAANLAFDAFGYRFSNKSEIQRVIVTVVENQGSESYERFQFESISLEPISQRSQLRDYFASLERAAPENDIKKRSSKSVRKWQDKTGKFSVEAQLVVYDGKKVVLQKTDGKTLEVPVEKLSDADKAYVDNL